MDEHHSWRIGELPPEIRPHSLAKHRVLQQYITRYVEVLTSNTNIPEFRLTLVDGFAGGALYRDWQTKALRHGSPLLMLEAMRDAAALAQLRRSKKFHLDDEYIFVEESKTAFPFLKEVLERSEFGGLLGTKIQLLNDSFINRIDHIIRHIRNRGRGNRAIFILDQCGYSDVPFSSIRSILSQLDKAEVILTFATDSLIDYLSEQSSMQKTLQALGLEISTNQIHSAKLGTAWRLAIQLCLHEQMPEKSGAVHYTPFFIRSKEAHRDYWLIHLSNHARARDVMVGLHWDENNSFSHYGKAGLTMLGYDPDFDIRVTDQPFLFDESAHAATLECLMNELPERVHGFKDGIEFWDFFTKLTNETPATSDIFKEALTAMLREGLIDVRDKTGCVKRQSGIQARTDILKPSGQRSLFVIGDTK